MDLISRALQKNLHLCGDINLEQQTWEQFEIQRVNKKVFVFGTGSALDYYLRNCCDHIKIAGVLDNDKKKQGQRLGWYCVEAFQTEYEDITIQSPDILEEYPPSEITILITSIQYYNQIIEQLKNAGIASYFVLLMMEANARKNLISKEEDFIQIRNDYTQYCCSKRIMPNKIVMSYGEYGGHAKYITKQILKRRKDLDIVWLVYDSQTAAPDGVRLVPERNWKRYTYEMETAKIWLFDITVHNHIVKRQGQIYIQAKHWSSITLKKFYLDDKSSFTSPEEVSRMKHNGEMMDYLLSGSDFDEDSCRSGFAFNGKAIRVGSSRSDILFDETIKEKIYHRFGLDIDAHIMLYAPTYRDTEYRESKSMSISLDINMLLDVLYNKFGGEWYVFVRLHPWLDFTKCGMEESERIVNAGNYPDSEELVAASDMMITDYSSIMFEEAFVKRPVFLYAPDKDEYIDGERGLLLDYNSLPFPIAETNDKLVQIIMDFDRQKYEEDVTSFLDRYGVHEDGHASERAAKFILDLLEQNK